MNAPRIVTWLANAMLIASCGGATPALQAPPAEPGSEQPGSEQPGAEQPGAEQPASVAPQNACSQEGDMVAVLAKIGVACPDAVDPNACPHVWNCTEPSEPDWPFTFAFTGDAGAYQVKFDSVRERAFAKTCDSFGNALADLADPANSFAVSCSDQSQLFQFSTTTAVATGADVQRAFAIHATSRNKAVKLLRSINALRR